MLGVVTQITTRQQRASYRQTKRVWRAYPTKGGDGRSNIGAQGGRSNRAIAPGIRRRALALIRKKYGGDRGDALRADLGGRASRGGRRGRRCDPETLRRWMLAEGLWSRARKAAAHRSRRERKAHGGELLQLDGSFHAWLEERGPVGCLMDLVDDATGCSVLAFSAEETTWAAVTVLRRWITSVWGAALFGYGLEDGVSPGADRGRARGGHGAPDAVWADVCAG